MPDVTAGKQEIEIRWHPPYDEPFATEHVRVNSVVSNARRNDVAGRVKLIYRNAVRMVFSVASGRASACSSRLMCE